MPCHAIAIAIAIAIARGCHTDTEGNGDRLQNPGATESTGANNRVAGCPQVEDGWRAERGSILQTKGQGQGGSPHGVTQPIGIVADDAVHAPADQPIHIR